jgi:hypothetical protein
MLRLEREKRGVVIGSTGIRLQAKTGKGKAGCKLRLERGKRSVNLGSAGIELQAKTGKGQAGCTLFFQRMSGRLGAAAADTLVRTFSQRVEM